ncbi:MAG: recombinase RecJ [Clostridiales bacterium]|nr:recombinase RecJ [Clostridiales bacterium]
MRLKELEEFERITIQCHDNPDADAIASGYGLFVYFSSKNKDVALIYCGKNRIQKKNLQLMIEKLEIPIQYVEKEDAVEGLLITVDCQYGAGNVTKLEATEIAIIDHHQIEIEGIKLSEIRSNLGSCSTLVWKMMSDEGFDFQKEKRLGTALYYGLFSDTNQFTEIYNPLDMDMKDSVPCEKSMIKLFRNSNLSLKELEIAGIAMLRHIYNDEYLYAIIKSQPCDPNILGLISDFLLQVDGVNTCVVYNEQGDRYKISVRSCIKEVDASELAAFLTEKIGSGGGHREKAGGFISKRLYDEYFPTLHSEAYFSQRMNEYFDNCEIITAGEYRVDYSGMKDYKKKKIPVGYVKASEVLAVGTPIMIRTLEGDIDMVVEPDLIIMIGVKGEIYPIKEKKFFQCYQTLEEKYNAEKHTIRKEYVPTLRNRLDGSSKILTDYAKTCIASQETYIHAIALDHMVKIFTSKDSEKYILGRPGDFLAVGSEDEHDIYIVEKDLFDKTYDLTVHI